MTARVRLLAQLLEWLYAQNILVWTVGLDIIWNDDNRNWDWPAQSRHFGPGNGDFGHPNRGPVRLYTVMPV
jgi:hypothetical protein